MDPEIPRITIHLIDRTNVRRASDDLFSVLLAIPFENLVLSELGDSQSIEHGITIRTMQASIQSFVRGPSLQATLLSLRNKVSSWNNPSGDMPYSGRISTANLNPDSTSL
ncbi:MAG: hypothetical protein M2R45_01307 [Verrucomicrobia subdivision 3 bacterium]|nr:hypothetical protein [Limisphaerales bacterium]MCS1415173.1 hypothetical protein [Limisphaerales bacterium]